MIEPEVLLDRYEMLYPDNTTLSDFRRAVVDTDFSSIFRMFGDEEDEMRRAFMEQNIHSIFRLLGPDYEELRKAVVEQNLHSIFRLVDQVDSEELRRACLEQNLYSLFRILEDHLMKTQAGLVDGDAIQFTGEDVDKEIERILQMRKAICNQNLHSVFKLIEHPDADDLRKAVLLKDPWSIFRLLNKHADTQFTMSFKTLWRQNMQYDEDCFSRGQLASKKWIIDTLQDLDLDLGTVYLCAGWYATLATMLFESDISVDKIRSFDQDYRCLRISEEFNKPWGLEGWRFKASTVDIHDMRYTKEGKYYYNTVRTSDNAVIKTVDKPNTVINTSCEHINGLDKWIKNIPNDALIILQSNNYFEIPEHVNCVRSADELVERTRLKKILYKGELELPKYTRYMVIGYK